MWGFGAMGTFLEFLVSNLQTYDDLKRYVDGLPSHATINYTRHNAVGKIYYGGILPLWEALKRYVQKYTKTRGPFYYFKIYYGQHDKKDKKYFKQYPFARNFGSLYFHEKKEGRSIRLGRDAKTIKYILDECRKKRQVIAIPVVVREQQHNYALVIAQNEDGKRMYVLTDSAYLESNRDRSLVKNLAEELRQ